jgi:hypothetical protein
MSRIVAILTGDLVGSTLARTEIVEATMATIRNCASQIDGQTDFTRFRGDGWQLRLIDPGDCLWACLLILARLRAQDDVLACRIAVGIGEEYPTDGHDLSTAMGPAFTASGRSLDQMKPDQLLALGSLPKKPDRFRKLAFTVAAEFAGRWTVGQAQAIALKLNPDSPADEKQSNETIARQLGITRQAVDARLKSGDYHILEEMIQAFKVEDFTKEAFYD